MWFFSAVAKQPPFFSIPLQVEDFGFLSCLFASSPPLIPNLFAVPKPAKRGALFPAHALSTILHSRPIQPLGKGKTRNKSAACFAGEACMYSAPRGAMPFWRTAGLYGFAHEAALPHCFLIGQPLLQYSIINPSRPVVTQCPSGKLPPAYSNLQSYP